MDQCQNRINLRLCRLSGHFDRSVIQGRIIHWKSCPRFLVPADAPKLAILMRMFTYDHVTVAKLNNWILGVPYFCTTKRVAQNRCPTSSTGCSRHSGVKKPRTVVRDAVLAVCKEPFLDLFKKKHDTDAKLSRDTRSAGFVVVTKETKSRHRGGKGQGVISGYNDTVSMTYST